MSEAKLYAVKPEIAATAHINQAEYQALYRRSIEEPEQFWADQATEFLDWSSLGIPLWSTTTPKALSAGLKAVN